MIAKKRGSLRAFISILLIICIFLSYLPVRAEGEGDYAGVEAEEVTDSEESTSEAEDSNNENKATATDAAEAEERNDSEEELPNVEEPIEIGGEGEALVFSAAPQKKSMKLMAASSDSVSLVKGKNIYYPANLGNYFTSYYTIDGKVAYCLESANAGPSSGSYAKSVLEGNVNLQKALYYGYGGTADQTDYYMGQFDGDLRYIFTHLAASYFYIGMEGFHGCTQQDLAECGVWGWIEYLESLPAPPDPTMSLSTTSLEAYVSSSGDKQVTDYITLNADSRNYISMTLPDDVTYHLGDTSQTGGTVYIYGDSKFWFSAPLSKTGNWSTGDMYGDIKTLWQAIAIKNSDTYQDIGSYETTTVANPVSLNVKWLDITKVKIKKVDSSSKKELAGAVFGIYSDSACTKLITEMPATDKSGSSSVDVIRTQNTVYIREITAPDRYVITPEVFSLNILNSDTVEYTVENDEQMGQLTIYKEGEQLDSATITDKGTTFNYKVGKLKGASFSVYAAADIYSGDGTKKYSAGDVIKKNLVTGDAGSVTLANLYLGKYKIVEDKAPSDYSGTNEEKTVTLSYAGQTVKTVFKESTYKNNRVKANVTVEKLDNDTKNPLKGGIYSLYSASDITNNKGTVIVPKGTLIQSVTTGANGKGTFSADIPIGFSYSVKETKAPDNYVRNEKDVYTFSFIYKGQSTATVNFTHTFKNERVNATIDLEKKDKELKTNVAQGDATLEGAVYGLYAREDIVHPDGKTGILYKKDTLITTLTTDKNAFAEVKNLYLGKYYLKEITAPVGYVPDTEEHDLNCSFEGDMVPTVKRTATAYEQVKKQPFMIIKAANNGKTDADLLEGAGFSAYLISKLSVKEDGSYDFESAEPIVIGENGETVMYTDSTGAATSIPIPYGKYIVREVETPHNYDPVDDFIVTVTEHKPDKPQVWRVLLDDEFEAKLYIIKKDDETKKAVLAKDTEFKIYDMDNNCYVEQITTYPKKKIHKSYFTNSEGYLVLPETLKIGHYRVEEVTAPYGYVLNKNYFEIDIDSNTPYEVDGDTKEAIIEVDYEDKPVKGNLSVVKTGEVLTGYGQNDSDDEKADFIYEVKGLAGAEYSVYAAEDIYTPDGQKDDKGNRVIKYAKDQLVGTMITGEDGKAEMADLPLGAYYVRETKAPEGFILNTEKRDIKFEYKDQDTPIIYQSVDYINERQKVDINAIKKDKKSQNIIAGAEFGLYAKEEIKAGDTVLFEADALIDTAVSDVNGNARFNKDLPLGKYYVKELKAPKGYLISEEVIDVDASYQGQDVLTVSLQPEIANEPTKVSFSKKDITTEKEIAGAKLSVIDSKGNVVDSWTSEKGKEHIIYALHIGETYILREELAAAGYLKATDVKFKVEETEEIQPVVMYDDVPTGLIIINKTAEVLEGANVEKDNMDRVKTQFNYIKKPLEGATFELYAADDIKNADGESADYYKKDELIGKYTTDKDGIIKVDKLPLGKYYVKEVSTQEGYILDNAAKEVDLSYVDQDTKVVEFKADYINDRWKAETEVIKTEKGTETKVRGAVFGLYTRDDIKNASGEVIIEKDSLIEHAVSDKDGKAVFTADLPVGYSFYVKETAPAPGYTTNDKVEDFKFILSEKMEAVSKFSFTYEDDVTKVQISKVDITGNNIAGAKLTIRDLDGNAVVSWTSTDNPYLFKRIPIGKYILHEDEAPDGYEVAEDVEFEVLDSGDIQKVEMTDKKKVDKPDSPKTGDSTDIMLLALMLLFSLGGIGGCFYLMKSTNKKSKNSDKRRQ